jgi:hypothetical protein
MGLEGPSLALATKILGRTVWRDYGVLLTGIWLLLLPQLAIAIATYHTLANSQPQYRVPIPHPGAEKSGTDAEGEEDCLCLMAFIPASFNRGFFFIFFHFSRELSLSLLCIYVSNRHGIVHTGIQTDASSGAYGRLYGWGGKGRVLHTRFKSLDLSRGILSGPSTGVLISLTIG